MAGGALEHSQGTGFLEKVGENPVTGGGGHQSISPVKNVGDTGSPNVQVRVMGDVRRYY